MKQKYVISKIGFAIQSDASVRQKSVAVVKTEKDLCSAYFGPTQKDPCKICQRTLRGDDDQTCNGHTGLLELALPVFTPIDMEQETKSLISCACENCGRITALYKNPKTTTSVGQKVVKQPKPKRGRRSRHNDSDGESDGSDESSESESDTEHEEENAENDDILDDSDDDSDAEEDAEDDDFVEDEVEEDEEEDLEEEEHEEDHGGDHEVNFNIAVINQEDIPILTTSPETDGPEGLKYCNLVRMHLLKIPDRIERLRYLRKRSRNIPTCYCCGASRFAYVRQEKDQYYFDVGYAQSKNSFTAPPAPKELYPTHVSAIFEKIPKSDLDMIGMAEDYPMRLIRTCWLIPSNNIRQRVITLDGKPCEPDMLQHLRKIVAKNIELNKELMKKNEEETRSGRALTGDVFERLSGQCKTLWNDLNYLFHAYTILKDKEMRSSGKNSSKKRGAKSVRAGFEEKEGLIRGHTQGKRVDYSGRAVITCDPTLKIHEIGIPLRIARIITKVMHVTNHNLAFIQELHANDWIVEHTAPDCNGVVVSTAVRRDQELNLIPGQSTVTRRLLPGDWILFNRQPTLHKMSMMAHQVAAPFHTDNTLKFNVTVTTPYNADFDGDEMNIHVPQGIMEDGEMRCNMSVIQCIVSPQASRPVIGLKQDALVLSYILGKADSLLSKKLMQECLAAAGIHHLPIPAILKPAPRWTGRQLLSLVMPKVNYEKPCVDDLEKTQAIWERKNPGMLFDGHMENAFFIVQDGEIVSGNPTKRSFGPSAGGIVHMAYEDFGPETAAAFLDQAQQVAYYWNRTYGYSTGIFDMQNAPEVQKKYDALIAERCEKAKSITNEQQINAELNKTYKDGADIVFEHISPQNQMMDMILSGSKGSSINVTQIMFAVGQQNVNGKRIPEQVNGRTTANYDLVDKNDVRWRGFVPESYITGLTPFGMKAHMCGGREGMNDTANKTADSGYSQRSLVKLMEDVVVRNDRTVRDANGRVVMYNYGYDDSDGTFLEEVPVFWSPADMNISKVQSGRLKAITKEYSIKPDTPQDQIPMLVQKLKEAKAELAVSMRNRYIGRRRLAIEMINYREDLVPTMQKINATIAEAYDTLLTVSVYNTISIVLPLPRMIVALRKLDGFTYPLDRLGSVIPPYTIPYIAYIEEFMAGVRLFQRHHVRLTPAVVAYLIFHLNPVSACMDCGLTVAGLRELFRRMVNRYLESRVASGEAAGPLAALCIGEPSTQMTLNTFHFAGCAEKNLTMGLPRLKQLFYIHKRRVAVMIRVHFKEPYCYDPDMVRRLADEFVHVKLDNIVEKNNYHVYNESKAHLATMEDNNGIPANTIDRNTLTIWNLLETDVILSDYCLRIEISKRMMVKKGIVLEDLADMVSHFLNKSNKNAQITYHVRYADENQTQLWLRVYLRFNTKQDRNAWAPHGQCNLLFQVRENVAQMTIRGLRSVRRAYEVELDKATSEFFVDIEGFKLDAVLAHPCVNQHRTYCNSPREMQRVFGIEGARWSLRTEIAATFDGNQIKINNQHYDILAATMTFVGELTAASRHGLKHLQLGVMASASFEENTRNIVRAAMRESVDPLQAISACIFFGKPGNFGTGSVVVRVDEERKREIVTQVPINVDILDQESIVKTDLFRIQDTASDESPDLDDDITMEDPHSAMTSIVPPKSSILSAMFVQHNFTVHERRNSFISKYNTPKGVKRRSTDAIADRNGKKQRMDTGQTMGSSAFHVNTVMNTMLTEKMAKKVTLRLK